MPPAQVDIGLTLPLIYLSFSLLRGLLIWVAVTIARWAGTGVHVPWQVRGLQAARALQWSLGQAGV